MSQFHLQAAQILCMFWSTYLCQQLCSFMKMNKTSLMLSYMCIEFWPHMCISETNTKIEQIARHLLGCISLPPVISTKQNSLLQFPHCSIHSPVLASFWIRVMLGDCCPSSSGLRVSSHDLCLICTHHLKRPECWILSLSFFQNLNHGGKGTYQNWHSNGTK